MLNYFKKTTMNIYSNEFEDKVKSLKGSEIIEAMIKGLEEPKIKIHMGTYGLVKEVKGKMTCFGCATTTIIEISDTKDIINIYKDYSRNMVPFNFLNIFERALDFFRIGDINSYNYFAHSLNIASISSNPDIKLPELRTDSFKKNLQPYKDLAKYNKSIGN